MARPAEVFVRTLRGRERRWLGSLRRRGGEFTSAVMPRLALVIDMSSRRALRPDAGGPKFLLMAADLGGDGFESLAEEVDFDDDAGGVQRHRLDLDRIGRASSVNNSPHDDRP
jgi:hypothetical protein